MSENQLIESKCVPCQGGIDPLSGKVVCALARDISSNWQIINEHHLAKEFEFKNFQLCESGWSISGIRKPSP